MAENPNDPTLAMHPVPSPIDYDWGSKEDQMVEDMLSPEFWRLWSQTAMRNRAVFERIFRPVCRPVSAGAWPLDVDMMRSFASL